MSDAEKIEKIKDSIREKMGIGGYGEMLPCDTDYLNKWFQSSPIPNELAIYSFVAMWNTIREIHNILYKESENGERKI